MAGQIESGATPGEAVGRKPVDAPASRLLEGLRGTPIRPLDVLTHHSKNLESNSEVFVPTRPTVLFHERTPEESDIKTFANVKKMMVGGHHSNEVDWEVIPADAVREVVLEMAAQDFSRKGELSFGKRVKYEVADNSSLWALGDYVQTKTGASPEQVVEVLLRDLSLYPEPEVERQASDRREPDAPLGSIRTSAGAARSDTRYPGAGDSDALEELVDFARLNSGQLNLSFVPAGLLSRIRDYPGGLKGALAVLDEMMEAEMDAKPIRQDPRFSDRGDTLDDNGAAAASDETDPPQRRGGTPRISDEQTMAEFADFAAAHPGGFLAADVLPRLLFRVRRLDGGYAGARAALGLEPNPRGGRGSSPGGAGKSGKEVVSIVPREDILTKEVLADLQAKEREKWGEVPKLNDVGVFGSAHEVNSRLGQVTLRELALETDRRRMKSLEKKRNGKGVPELIHRDHNISSIRIPSDPSERDIETGFNVGQQLRVYVSASASYAACREDPSQMNVEDPAAQKAAAEKCKTCPVQIVCFATQAQRALEGLAEAPDDAMPRDVLGELVKGQVRGGMTPGDFVDSLVFYPGDAVSAIGEVAQTQVWQDKVHRELAGIAA